MLFFELLSFSFSLKETLTLLKQYTAKRKMISEDSITDTVKRASKKLQEDCVLRSQEKWSKCQQVLIFMNDNAEYLQVILLYSSKEDSVNCKQIPQ